jgi:hypothetical protein
VAPEHYHPVRPEWACWTDLAKRIILALFVRTSVDSFATPATITRAD